MHGVGRLTKQGELSTCAVNQWVSLKTNMKLEYQVLLW